MASASDGWGTGIGLHLVAEEVLPMADLHVVDAILVLRVSGPTVGNGAGTYAR